MISLPLQTTTGGVEVVVLLFISFLMAIVLSLVIGVKGIRSYQETHNQGIALLTVGILLLSGLAVSINVVLTTFTAIPNGVVTTGVNLVRLLGVVVIIVTIHDW